MELDIYDFDKTVLPYDSGSRFFLFCLARYPYLFLLLPFYSVAGLLYLLHILPLSVFKKHVFAFVRFIPLDKAVKAFWDKHEADIFPWFLPEHRERPAVVISASPDFLLEEIAKRLKVDTLLCTHHDRKSGTLLGENCKHAEKVRRFYAAFPKNTKVCCVYSDGYETDQPIFALGAQCIHIEKDGTKTPFSYAQRYKTSVQK